LCHWPKYINLLAKVTNPKNIIPIQVGITSKIFFHICDVQILANFASKIAKLVEITLEKNIYPKFPRFFWSTKSKNSLQKKTLACYIGYNFLETLFKSQVLLLSKNPNYEKTYEKNKT